MITLEELLRQQGSIDAEHLERWIARGLVRPEGTSDSPRFADVDVARIRLLVELHEEFSFEEEAVETMMDLLDQVHSLRRRLSLLARAIEQQPKSVRRAIEAELQALAPSRE